MTDLPDALLLSRFVERQDEQAFRTLVNRHLGLVFSIARRITGADDMAREVSQLVFIRLARRAASVRPSAGLSPWLHSATRSLALNALRDEKRRRIRESKAALEALPMDTSSSSESWEILAPAVDDLVARLSPQDRQVVLLRYYENRPLAVVAAAMGLSEEAARKRALRALEKLRTLFAKRGIATSSSALATLLPLHAAPLPPIGLAAVIGASSFSAAPASLTWFAMTTTTKLTLGSAVILSLVVLCIDSSLDALHRAREVSSGASRHPAAAASSMSAVRPARPGPSSVAQLEEAAKISNLFERRRALEAVLSSLPKADFPAAARKLAALDFDASSGEMRLLASHWSALDAPGVYAFSAVEDGLPGLLPLATEEWGKHDFDAAFAKVMDLPNSHLRDEVLCNNLLLPLAADDPSHAFAAMGKCLSSLIPLVRTSVAVEILQKHPGSLRRLAGEIPPEVDRNNLLSSFAAGVSYRGGRNFRGVDPSQEISYSHTPSSIALDDQVFAAEWVAGNPDVALSSPELDCGNLFHALALADRDLAAGIAAKIPADTGSLREIVWRAIESADSSSAAAPTASDDSVPGKP